MGLWLPANRKAVVASSIRRLTTTPRSRGGMATTALRLEPNPLATQGCPRSSDTVAGLEASTPLALKTRTHGRKGESDLRPIVSEFVGPRFRFPVSLSVTAPLREISAAWKWA